MSEQNNIIGSLWKRTSKVTGNQYVAGVINVPAGEARTIRVSIFKTKQKKTENSPDLIIIEQTDNWQGQQTSRQAQPPRSQAAQKPARQQSQRPAQGRPAARPQRASQPPPEPAQDAFPDDSNLPPEEPLDPDNNAEPMLV